MATNAGLDASPAASEGAQPGPAPLDGVPETLLIPLAARANAKRLHPDLGFDDPQAAELFARVPQDAGRFLDDRSSMRGAVLRAQWFDQVARDFLTRHPGGLCVSMGSGLDTRPARLPLADYPNATWVDVDLPAVVAWRAALIAPTDRVYTVAADLTAPGWLDRVDWPAGQPALFLAEGVLMYLDADDAEGLIAALCQAANRRAAEMELAFDYASPLMVRFSRRHPSVAKTDASFHWGLKRPSDLARIDPDLRMVGIGDVMRRSGVGPAAFMAVYRALTFGRRFYACLHLARRP